MTQRSSRARTNAPTTVATMAATAATVTPSGPSSTTHLPPQTTSHSRPSTPPPRSHTLMTSSKAQENLRRPDLGVYLGHPGLPASALFYLGGAAGNILISSTTQKELILRGVFQISRSECFLSPDGGYQPKNQFDSKFEDVKLSCKLSVTDHDNFQFMLEDVNAMVKNIKGFEALIEHHKDDTVISALQMSGGWHTIKMVHPLFVKKVKKPLNENVDSGPEDDNSDSEDLGDEFKIENWPVSQRCEDQLQAIIDADTHSINPLPVFDLEYERMSPRRYKNELPGAIVLASLAFSHFHVKSNKRHIFNTVCRELVILRTADELPSSPYKKRRFAKRPLFLDGDDLESITASSSLSQTRT